MRILKSVLSFIWVLLVDLARLYRNRGGYLFCVGRVEEGYVKDLGSTKQYL